MFKVIQLTKSILRLSDYSLNKCKYGNRFVRLSYIFETKCFVSNVAEKNSVTDVKIEGINESIDIVSLTQNDPELEKKLRIIILEADILRQESGKVPELKNLKEYHWRELLSKTSRSQRNKYFDFLFKIEKKKENEKVKKDKAKEERENRGEYVDDGHIRYGLNHNTFLMRVYDSTMNNLYNNKLINAIQFGQKLVIDCGYDKHMTSRECLNTAKQIMLLFSENRIHDEPFDLHLCNVDSNSKTLEMLQKNIPIMYEPWFPINIHKESYLNLFPKDALVYLSPHCREELIQYDHDAVYIIGAIVDKINNEPLSLARAKKEGLKTAKFPLDKYLQWGSGSGKSLTLNHCTSILLDVKKTGDWNYALRHVPRRKIIQENIESAFAKQNILSNRMTDRKFYKRRVNTRDKNFVTKLLTS